ncbi:c-type cytochrome [Ideonella sp. A 288]|uniref:c-type cytochrome n=1 Tax=Ideonella sp. A 288 TaxID=1962181 RepID=UPI000B4B0CCA|nr:c-type cytochrome [Ideonella sp. A 288]
MNLTQFRKLSIALATLLAAAGIATPSLALDADAAQAVFKKNDCGKCHAPEKDKKGPSLKKIAEKYKGKADGEEKTIKNMVTGTKVKLDDGTEEEHKVIKLDPAKPADAAALKNLAGWILAR